MNEKIKWKETSRAFIEKMEVGMEDVLKEAGENMLELFDISLNSDIMNELGELDLENVDISVIEKLTEFTNRKGARRFQKENRDTLVKELMDAIFKKDIRNVNLKVGMLRYNDGKNENPLNAIVEGIMISDMRDILEMWFGEDVDEINRFRDKVISLRDIDVYTMVQWVYWIINIDQIADDFINERADRVLKNQSDKARYCKKFRGKLDEITECLFSKVLEIYPKYVSDRMINNAKVIKKQDKELANITEKLKLAKEKNIQNTTQIRELTKMLKKSIDGTEVSKIGTQIKGVENNVVDIKDMCKKLANNMLSKENLYKSMCDEQVDRMIAQVAKVKADLMKKEDELKVEIKSHESYILNIEENFLKYLDENEVDDDYKEVLIEKVGGILEKDCVELNDSGEEEVSFEETVTRRTNNYKIGYIDYVNDKPIFIDKFGAEMEIEIESEQLYIAQNQFVSIDSNGKLMKASTSMYKDNGIGIQGLDLGIVEDSSLLHVRLESGEVTVPSLNGSVNRLRKGQVVGIKNGIVVRPFKNIKLAFDNVEKCLKYKNQESYFVLQKFESAMLVRNIRTGEESLEKFELDGNSIDKGDVIFVKENRIVIVWMNRLFYTASSVYKDRIAYGCLKIIDGYPMIEKQNGEISLINDFPLNSWCTDGDVIVVDEFNNYLYRAPEDNMFSKATIKKTAKQVVGAKNELCEIIGNVTIVGNPGYSVAYKSSFRKEGYTVNIIDGFDATLDKVIRLSKDSDAIIVTTDYCSHEIFWATKDANKSDIFGEKPYIVTSESGASFLTRKFIETRDMQEVAFSVSK